MNNAIKVIISSSYAYKGKPWKSQPYLRKDTTLIVGKDVDEEIAQKAVNANKAEYITIETEQNGPVNEDFDPKAASFEEMKAFVRSDSEIDELLDLRTMDEDELREELVSLLDGE
jgi:hypothetical protein